MTKLVVNTDDSNFDFVFASSQNGSKASWVAQRFGIILFFGLLNRMSLFSICTCAAATISNVRFDQIIIDFF